MVSVMSKRILCVISLIIGFSAFPQAAYAELKVGYFNFRTIIENVPQAKEAEKKLEAEFAPKQKKISDLDKKIKDAKADLEKNAVVLSDADLLNKQRELRAQERELKLQFQEYKEDVTIRRNQEMSAIQKLVYEAAMEIAKSESYDLILHDGALYASSKIDLTSKILKKLAE